MAVFKKCTHVTIYPTDVWYVFDSRNNCLLLNMTEVMIPHSLQNYAQHAWLDVMIQTWSVSSHCLTFTSSSACWCKRTKPPEYIFVKGAKQLPKMGEFPFYIFTRGLGVPIFQSRNFESLLPWNQDQSLVIQLMPKVGGCHPGDR